MDKNRIAKKRWVWTPDGVRPTGRPKKRWKDTINETLNKPKLPNLSDLRKNNIFEDRRKWRDLVTGSTDRNHIPT
jgi:hypothetical protein